MILAPILFLVVLEGALELYGYGYNPSYWLRSKDGSTWLSNAHFCRPLFGLRLAREPIPTVVSTDKPERTFRIFVFGGSAAKGTPESTFSFARILEAMLNDRYSETNFEVINTGVTAINSNIVLPIVRDCRHLKGDVYIVYMGNNEVVGPYGPGTVITGWNPSRWLISKSVYARSSRTGQLLNNVLKKMDDNNRTSWHGMEMFQERRISVDNPRLDSVYHAFRNNLEDIYDEGRRVGAAVVVSTVVTNLKDLPPFASVNRNDLPQDELAAWQSFFAEGKKLQDMSRYEEALDRFVEAEKIDDHFAELHYRIGQCLQQGSQHEQALRHFVLARDKDVLRFRADSHINQIIRQTASGREEENIYLVDVIKSAELAAFSEGGMFGLEVLYEHVHLNFQGNYAVAATLFRKISQLLPRKSDSKKPDANEEPPTLQRCAELTLHTDVVKQAMVSSIDRMIRRPPFTKEWYQMVVAQRERQQTRLSSTALKESLRLYQQTLEPRSVEHKDPPRTWDRAGDIHLRRIYAKLLEAAGSRLDAIDQYQRILNRYPHWTKIRIRLAKALSLEGQFMEAAAEADLVLKMDHPYNLDAHHILGETLVRNGQPGEAAAHMRFVVSSRPRDAVARADLGRLLLMMDEPKEAEQHLAIAAEVAPSNADYLISLGMARTEQGELTSAMEAFRKAARFTPQNPLAHYQIAVVAHRLHDRELAERHYRRAISLDPTIARKDDTLRMLLEKSEPLGEGETGE